MYIRVKSKRLKQNIGQMFGLLLVILYVVGTSQLEFIHSFAHDHEALVSHTPEQEKDPCHRLIYHDDVEQGCHHHSHLIVSDKCQICDHVYHGDQNLSTNVSFSTLEFSQVQFCIYKQELDSYWAVISSSRAPPVIA